MTHKPAVSPPQGHEQCSWGTETVHLAIALPWGTRGGKRRTEASLVLSFLGLCQQEASSLGNSAARPQYPALPAFWVHSGLVPKTHARKPGVEKTRMQGRRRGGHI